MTESTKEHSESSLARGGKEFLSGTFAGVVGTVFGHPLDLIKVRLQTQRHLYTGAFDCFRKILKHEGIVNGFYRGIFPPLISLTFLNTLAFGCFAETKHLFHRLNEHFRTNLPNGSFVLPGFNPRDPNFGLAHWQYFAAGGVTGAFAGFFSTPFELVKVRVQLDNVTEKRFRGSFHCMKEIARHQGLRALCTGYRINFLREVTFCSVYFGFYEHLKVYLSHIDLPYTHLFHSRKDSVSPLAIVIAGGLSGVMGWMTSFPLDSIKANIQGESLLRGQKAKKITVAAKEIWQQRGLKGFYSGLGPSVARAFIVSSSRFSAYEFAMRTLDKYLSR